MQLHHQETSVAPHVPARRRRHARRLPLLDSMVPALHGARADRRQLPDCGWDLLHAARRGDGQLDAGRRRGASKLSPILAPLEAYKDQVVVVSNLAHAMAGPQGPGDNGGDHTRCPAVFLNGVHPKRTDGADIHAGITIDQIAAAEDRPGHAAAVARTGDRGLQRPGRIVRRRLQLHVHEHDFVAHADGADADGDQSARRVRPDVRRRRHRRGAASAHRDRSAAFSMR